MINSIKGTRKKTHETYKNLKSIFLKSALVPSKRFFLNKRGYNFNLIKIFFKTRLGEKKNISILDICNSLDKTIPHYCYHFNLSIAGNCRMCLVELYKSVKPIVACAVEIAPNQRISTETFLVKRARQGIMEFLLVNHPLDCPICDQGGECDLQDQSLVYGSDRGRFYHISDKKRSVNELICNHFINLILTRCIHCTRCIRFLNEVAGEYSLGMLGRGKESEIGLYTNTFLSSELASNITDFCPVGALTIKYYALKERPWEEDYIESIDLSDSLCAPIRVYTTGVKIKRILPDFNTDLSLSWITEKTRFFWDSLIVQQLDYPTINILNSLNKQPKNIELEYFLEGKYYDIFFNENTLLEIFDNSFNNFEPEKNIKTMMAVSWKSIGYILLNKMKNMFSTICSYYTGTFLDLETLLQVKESALYYSSNNINGSHFLESVVNEDFDYNYIFKINNFNKYKNILLINMNLRLENPILNAKLRQKYLWDKKIKIFILGEKYNLTYKYIQLGLTTKTLLSLIEGRHYLLNSFNSTSSNLILYSCELRNCYKASFHRTFFSYLKNLNRFFDINYLAQNAASVNSLDLSLNRFIVKRKRKNLSKIDKINNNYLYYYICCNTLKYKKFNSSKKLLAHKTFIYQNSHGDNFFWFMDFFLPSYSYGEKELGYYINTFGILRKTRQILLPRNAFIQDNVDLIRLVHKMVYDLNFNSKSFFKNENSLRLYSYIPIHLFLKRRLKNYNILENKFNYSFVYFYKYSLKQKNFYKTNILSTYSANLNMISYLHFSRKSNLNL